MKLLHMYKILIAFFIVLFLNTSLIAQDSSRLNQAIQLGKELKFEEAIDILQKEIKINPKNAEAYYWLGRYSHFLVYDTRPFTKKSDSWSKNEVIENLKKAINLKPDFGDAYYFLAAEYGARARESLKKGDATQAKKELIQAHQLGGFPNYLIEYARSILSSCDKDAILFSNWDAPVNALMYVQLAEGFRKDVSLIILNLLERPYYVKLLRDGIPNEINNVPINWNDNLIMDMHSYFPWNTLTIKIPVSAFTKREYLISDSVTQINLDIPGQYGGSSLWIGTAAILNILENNKYTRPIFCALPKGDDMFYFTDYLKAEGFVSRLMPYKTKNTDFDFDTSKIENSILTESNYKHFNEIIIHNQPRTNYFFGDNRRHLILDYVEHLISNNNTSKARLIYLKMDTLMPSSIYPLSKDVKDRCSHIEPLLHQ